MRKIDIAIIGGGPAGLTAGLYAARAGFQPVLFEEGFPGGQAATTDVLHNYPGFPSGVGGPELMQLFQKQAEDAGMRTEYTGIRSLSVDGDVRRLTDSAGTAFEADAVILCIGAKARTLDIPGEADNIGRGVSYCATCDGAIYRGRHVAVVGGGNTAVEDALYLARICESVSLIHRRTELRAIGRDVERLRSLQNVRFLLPETVSSLSKADGDMHLRLGSGGEIAVAALFVAVGTVPQTEWLRDTITLDPEGYIVAGEDTLTSLPGVFAAGDARRKPLRQVVTAASDGAVAANAAVKYLSGQA